MKNGFENFEDMKKMQQDAIKRTHEMNSRAKNNSNCEANNSQSPNENKKEEHKNKEKDACFTEHNEPLKEIVKNFSILDSLFSDPEKSLILILMFIFLDEDTNPMLIMALMYLLM